MVKLQATLVSIPKEDAVTFGHWSLISICSLEI